MTRALGLIIAATAAVAVAGGCAGTGDRGGLTPDQLLARLRELPGVTVDERTSEEPDRRYYVLHFTQPVDHDDESQGTFQQEVSLLHRSDVAEVPMVVHTSGYDDFTLGHAVELTRLLAANQVSIEHRYYGTSLPQPMDWTRLTIAQMAADEHEIINALRTIYAGAFVTTGVSKGGMTAMYHRRFYPDDVEGTVSYVAPISFDAPDRRYADYIADMVGPIGCRQAVRDIATEMLSHRRDAIIARAQADSSHVYTEIAIGAAVEAAVVAFEWTFWQYHGVGECSSVPAVTASDKDVLDFLEHVSPVSDCDDDQVDKFKPYYYQSYTQLGYPDGGYGYLVPYLHYTDVDYTNELPFPDPAYDRGDAMREVDDYVEHRASHLLFIYGEWDPWSGGKFALGEAKDSAELIQTHGTHAAWITNLELSDRQEAFAKLQAWTGVVPMASRVQSSQIGPEVVPRIPAVLGRALRSGK
jgi:hypothetical protein